MEGKNRTRYIVSNFAIRLENKGVSTFEAGKG